MNTDFYGNDTDTFSYLEFGAITPSQSSKKVYDFYTDNKAYDWFMHARYSNDLVAYCKMIELFKAGENKKAAELYREQVHHKDDFSNNLSKLLALSLFKGPSFFELGQTLFGCIEGISSCMELLHKNNLVDKLDLRKVKWLGFDISDFFNTLAVQLHKGYDVQTSNDYSAIPNKYSIFFAKGVTLLYAVRSTDDFARFIDSSELMVFDYSLSSSKSELVSIGTGKGVFYISSSDFKSMVAASGKTMLLRKDTNVRNSNGRVFIEGVCGSKELVTKFVERDATCRTCLADLYPNESSILFHRNSPSYLEWITIDEIV